MKAEQHQGKGLVYLNILPDGYDPDAEYPLVVMLHGFGANMRDLAGLAPSINRDGYVYSCPNAPIPFNLGPGMTGYGWHPPRGEATPEDFQQAEDLVAGYFDEVFEQLKASPGQVVLLGFSQGGGMTYRCGLGRPELFAGLVALSASLPDPNVLRPKLPEDRNQAIFIAHGDHDPMIGMDTAQAARRFLEEEGYSPSYHEYSMGHEIPPAVLADLAPWLAETLPARAAA
jgi:phospholipase/carboxylesterase